MKRLLALLALLAAYAAAPVHAQQYRIVDTCGAVAPFGAQPAGSTAYPTMDTSGHVCTSGGSGGGVSSFSTTCGSTTLSGPSGGAVTNSSNVPVVTKSASYTITGADCGTLFVIPAGTAAGVTLTLPSPAAVGAGYNINGVINLSSFAQSVASPSGTFNSAASPISIPAGQGVNGLATDATNWRYVPTSAGGSTPTQNVMAYVSGFYYPPNEAVQTATGNITVRAAGSLFCQPLRVSYPGFTTNSVFAITFVADATATWAAAIYANDPATGKPAALLGNTNSVAASGLNLSPSMTSTTPTAGTGGATTTVAVPYGLSWICDTNSAGGGTIKMQSDAASTTIAMTIGASAAGNVFANANLINGYSCVIGGTCGGGTAWAGTTVVFPTTLVGATMTAQTSSGGNFTQMGLKVN